ncbi:MAG: NifB/NifX family molybdenum-iron cluster-binding protein [Anaerolineaceae bacterium]|nr:NifB/NifX family molybdenum-iron cluster-binding protein [Anaerolineaceae bacterium]
MMKIAISAESNNGLESKVSHHFGRCPYYILVEMEGEEVKNVSAIDNPYFAGHEAGKVPGFIHGHQVDVMISGGMGRRAIDYFTEYQIQVSTGAGGTVNDALKAFFAGELLTSAPCKESVEHHSHH